MFAYTPQSVNDSIGITWFKRCQSSQRVGLEDVGIFIPWLKPRCMVLARCSARVADPSWTRGRGPRPMFKKSAAGVFLRCMDKATPKSMTLDAWKKIWQLSSTCTILERFLASFLGVRGDYKWKNNIPAMDEH